MYRVSDDVNSRAAAAAAGDTEAETCSKRWTSQSRLAMHAVQHTRTHITHVIIDYYTHWVCLS